VSTYINIYDENQFSSTYDHRILTILLPVRSAYIKQDTGGLVVRWVTTGESPLLYVLGIFLEEFLGYQETSKSEHKHSDDGTLVADEPSS
jgi:hypothetical protein